MVNWSAINQKWNSLGGNLAAELELMIVRGELPQGEKIPPERELAATLGVSRATLREALLELEIKGLLSRRPGRGTIVLEAPTESQFEQLSEAFAAAQQDFSQVMEMRLAIEPAVARLAAAKATAADIRKLEQILAASEIETSSMKLLELDQTFHVALSDIARNPLLSDLIRIVGDWAGASRRLGFQGGKRKEASLHGHWQIVDALRVGQPDLAESAMREHIAGIQNLIAPTPGERQGNS